MTPIVKGDKNESSRVAPSKVYHLFSAMFSKRDNFHDILFAFLEEEVFLKWGLLLKEFALMVANSCLYEMTPIYIGGNNENDIVASPECPFSLKPHLKLH